MNKFKAAEQAVQNIREDTYTFPEVIILDAKSFEDFEHHVKNPRPPTPKLCAIFKR